MSDLNMVLAGAAGQGVQSAAGILSTTMMRLGLHVYSTEDYQSRIRGGHNFMRIRCSERPLAAAVRRIDYLLALNAESLHIHLPDLAVDGMAFCMDVDRGDVADPRLRVLTQEVGPAAARTPRYVGVKLLAMLFAALGYPLHVLIEAVEASLGKRLKPEILELNAEVIRAVSDFAFAGQVRPPVFGSTGESGRLLVSGNDAIALGMIAAGIGVYTGYPMSPATSIMSTLAQVGGDAGIAVEQVEDEIAALNAALGAAYAGARSATGSSGGGLSLMTEAIGLAGVTETPVVIVDAQRPGPATGMATRTEQSDLLFIVHAAQGEFPRVVLSPSDHENAFYLTAEAFNIAERWQVPVFILDDQAFADAQRTVPEFDLSRVSIDRGAIAPEPVQSGVLRRYEVTDSGVSPRAYPVLSKWIVVQDSHEHDEVGHLTDDPANRVRQVEKRMRKLAGIAATAPGPEMVHAEADTLFLCWGSTAGPLREAVEILRERDRDLGVAVFRHLYPMNAENVRSALGGARRLITVEGNYTGQLGQLLLLQTGVKVHGHIGKIDGRLFTVEDVVELIAVYLESGV